jgi:hypothetical protein
MTVGSALDRAVANELAGGASLVSQAGTSAVLTAGRPVNHILHLILSVLTAGLWLFVWVALVLTNKKQRIVLTMDANGQVSKTVTTGQ